MSGVIATFPMFIFNTQKIGGEQQTHEQSGNAAVESDMAVEGAPGVVAEQQTHQESGGSAMEADVEAVVERAPGEVAEQQTHQQSGERADVDRTGALVVPAGASAGAESVSSKGN